MNKEEMIERIIQAELDDPTLGLMDLIRFYEKSRRESLMKWDEDFLQNLLTSQETKVQ